MKKTRVGIVGYGSLGKYLTRAILEDPKVKSKFELAFLWNRSSEKVKQDSKLSKDVILEKLEDFPLKKPDLIVEVAHPSITAKYGPLFLEHADFFCGSPTIFADRKVEAEMKSAVEKFTSHGVYIPAGALWGAQDIEKMSRAGTLKSLSITMKKHPLSLKVEEPLMKKLQDYINDEQATGEFVVYEGSVRQLCPLAPNNVNTMACAAIAGSCLGFDKVKARLVADKQLKAHIIEIVVGGPGEFKVSTERYNPAVEGAVTGNATYGSFLSSLLVCGGKGGGFHLC